MSHLRNQLQLGKESYQSIRYPGDLANDVLLHRRRGWVVWLSIGAAVGIAAMIALTILPNLLKVTNSIDAPKIAQTTPGTFDIGALPEFPAGVGVVPTYQAMSMPTIPAFPSLTDLEEQSNETSKEQV